MKLRFFFLPLVVAFWPFLGWSQNECGMPDSAPPPSGTDPEIEVVPCFDAEQVFEDCSPVYVNVNLHIFTTADCQGATQQFGGSSQVAGFALAEGLIARGNALRANNPEQWPRQDPHVIVCDPFRYVLRGIYMHCKDNANISSLANLTSLKSTYGVNVDTELNFFIGDYPGDKSGRVNDIPGTFGGVENESEGNFNHEIGHIFDLYHVEPGDGCDDTNPIYYDWDANCNGTLEPGETHQLCWTQNVNQALCNLEPTCPNYPCCSWDFQNNNCMMGKSAYQEAFSECQVTRMLARASTGGCDYVTQIGGVGPPNAFITQTAWDVANTVYCGECLILSASFNDEGGHSLNIYEGTGNTAPLVYSSGWLNRPAENFCYTTVRQEGLSNHLLDPNTTYTALLTVRNGANVEDTKEFVFTTPGTDCSTKEPDPENRLTVSPNPTNAGSVQLKFDAESSMAALTVRAIHQITGATQVLLNNYTPVSGENTVSVNVSSLATGHYSINVSNSSRFYQTQFIKL